MHAPPIHHPLTAVGKPPGSDRQASSSESGDGPGFAPTPISRNGNSPEHGPGAEPAAPGRRRSALFNLFIALAIAAFVLPAIVIGVAYFADLGPFKSPLFPVSLYNDGSAPVVVRDCGTDCTSSHQPYTLDPGKSVQVGASDNGDITRYYLHDVSTGAVIGCLPLEFHQKVSGLTIHTSQAETCPGNPLPVPS